MGDEKSDGEFLEVLNKEISRRLKMSPLDWIKEAVTGKVDDIILKETVKSLCNIVIMQEERISKLEGTL